MWVYGLNWAGPGWRQLADACECGNEPWGSVKWCRKVYIQSKFFLRMGEFVSPKHVELN